MCSSTNGTRGLEKLLSLFTETYLRLQTGHGGVAIHCLIIVFI